MNLIAAGMIGGLGGALENQGKILREDEQRVQAKADRKELESWTLQQRELYQVRAEERAVKADIAKDERGFNNEVQRAPVKREMKVADETASAAGKLKFQDDNLETSTRVKRAEVEAGESESTRKVREAQADYYSGRNEVTANAAANKGAGKLRPEVKEEVDSLDAEIKASQSEIDKAKLGGTWQGTPEQKAIESRVTAQRLRRRALLQGGGPADAPAADPLGMRKSAPSKPPKPGSMASTSEEMDRELILNTEYDKAHKAMEAASDDETRNRARNDIEALEREAKGAKVTLRRGPAGGTGMVVKGGAASSAPAAPVQASFTKPSPQQQAMKRFDPPPVRLSGGNGASTDYQGAVQRLRARLDDRPQL
jgi:hypothetical protein